MDTIQFLGWDCVYLGNDFLSLLVTQSVGPRIISLRLHDGNNIFAILPDDMVTRPDGRVFNFYGGHRLWIAPETMSFSYEPDDQPVDIQPITDGLVTIQPVDSETGIQKSMHIMLTSNNRQQITIRHTLTNHGNQPVICAPWAITQLKPDGIAILPQSQQRTGFAPNRSLAIWPYTDLENPSLHWGNKYILLQANMKNPFKIGFRNPRGWMGYYFENSILIKKAMFDPQAAYVDFNSSSQCYINEKFVELETMSPLVTLNPETSVSHTEIWELHSNIQPMMNETDVQNFVEQLGLE
jgi:hypothetical protein